MALKTAIQERAIWKTAIWKRAVWNNLPGKKHDIWGCIDTRKKEDALRKIPSSISFLLVKEEGVLRRN